MKRCNRIILCILLTSCFFAGCGGEGQKSKQTPENASQPQNQADKPQEEKTEEGKQDIEVETIDANLLEEKKKSGEEAIVIVGDSESEKYEQLLDTVSEIARARDVEIYFLDLKAEENQEWKSENDVFYEMNVAIMTNGYKVVCGMEIDEMYQKEVLENLIDAMLLNLKEL